MTARQRYCDKCGGELDRSFDHLEPSDTCDAYKAEQEKKGVVTETKKKAKKR